MVKPALSEALHVRPVRMALTAFPEQVSGVPTALQEKVHLLEAPHVSSASSESIPTRQPCSLAESVPQVLILRLMDQPRAPYALQDNT
jgi:hypothetical protein